MGSEREKRKRERWSQGTQYGKYPVVMYDYNSNRMMFWVVYGSHFQFSAI